MTGGVSRREVLRQLALAATAASTGAFNLEAARVVHALAGEGRAQPGGYAPQALTMREFRAVTRLAELIIPADASGGSGVDAGAPEFIDLLCSQNAELADIFTGGLAWLDAAMGRREGARFVDTPPDRQTAMLDALVASERDGRARDMGPGVNFFSWIRRLTVDAYYTSPIGIRDVGYRGNASLRSYETPAAALEHINRVADDLGL